MTQDRDSLVARLEPGQIQWHSSEEGGGPDVGKLLQIDDENALWVGEISRSTWEKAGGEALGSDGGWWIIHYTKDDHHVIGKCLHDGYGMGEFLELISAAIIRSPDFLRRAEAAAALSRPEQVVTDERVEAAMKAFAIIAHNLTPAEYDVDRAAVTSANPEGLAVSIRAMRAAIEAACLTTAAPLQADSAGVTEEPHRQRFKSGIRAAIAWLHHRARFDMNDPHAKAILNTAAYHLGNDLSHNCIKPENSAALPSLSRIRTDAAQEEPAHDL